MKHADKEWTALSCSLRSAPEHGVERKWRRNMEVRADVTIPPERPALYSSDEVSALRSAPSISASTRSTTATASASGSGPDASRWISG